MSLQNPKTTLGPQHEPPQGRTPPSLVDFCPGWLRSLALGAAPLVGRSGHFLSRSPLPRWCRGSKGHLSKSQRQSYSRKPELPGFVGHPLQEEGPQGLTTMGLERSRVRWVGVREPGRRNTGALHMEHRGLGSFIFLNIYVFV